MNVITPMLHCWVLQSRGCWVLDWFFFILFFHLIILEILRGAAGDTLHSVPAFVSPLSLFLPLSLSLETLWQKILLMILFEKAKISWMEMDLIILKWMNGQRSMNSGFGYKSFVFRSKKLSSNGAFNLNAGQTDWIQTCKVWSLYASTVGGDWFCIHGTDTST